MPGTLRVVHDQGRGGGQHVAKRFLLLRAQFDGVNDERVGFRRKDEARDVAASRPRVPFDEECEAGVAARPLLDIAGGVGNHNVDLDLVDGLGGLINVPLPHADAGDLAYLLAQAPELKRIKQAVDGGHIRGTTRQITRRDLEVHVGEQAVQAAVTHDVVHVLAQGGAALATDFVGARQQVIQSVVLVDPLSGGLGANAGDAGQIVRGLPDNRSDLGVAMRRNTVLVFHCLRSHAAQVARACARVEDRHVVGHRLEGVAVSRHDEDGGSIVASPICERGEDIVRLVALPGQ